MGRSLCEEFPGTISKHVVTTKGVELSRTFRFRSYFSDVSNSITSCCHCHFLHHKFWFNFIFFGFVAWFLEAQRELGDKAEIWTWWEGWQNVGRNSWELEYFKGNGKKARSQGSHEAQAFCSIGLSSSLCCIKIQLIYIYASLIEIIVPSWESPCFT